MKHLLFAALMGVLLACQSPGQAQAATPQDYLEQGNYDAARASLAQLVKGDPNGPLHQAYLEGQILMRQNQPAAAVDLFRDLVRIAPDYEPARRELTLLLAYRGDVTAARYHAERLVAETADEQLRAGLQTFILNNTSRKPGGFALRFALLPSSNQTRGSAEQEILIGGVPFTLNPA
ncbi:MAG: tetratricopeptide repeat protein, partial [Sulfitobacter sp.]|nr:tetratricopeptide repeat protein [Sulfitobacter sp.]